MPSRNVASILLAIGTFTSLSCIALEDALTDAAYRDPTIIMNLLGFRGCIDGIA